MNDHVIDALINLGLDPAQVLAEHGEVAVGQVLADLFEEWEMGGELWDWHSTAVEHGCNNPAGEVVNRLKAVTA